MGFALMENLIVLMRKHVVKQLLDINVVPYQKLYAVQIRCIAVLTGTNVNQEGNIALKAITL